MIIFEDNNEIQDFFKNEFKSVKILNDSNELEIPIDGEANFYNLIVLIQDHHILLTLDPYGPTPHSDECAYRLHKYLLQANNEMKWGFFSIDNDGSSELNINLPLSGLNDHIILRAIDHLRYYGDRHYFNVLNLANNSQATISLDDE